MPWVRRPRRPPSGEPVPDAQAVAPPPADAYPAEPLPRPSRMRRERRVLERRREIEIRDVGGLAVEMVRRDRFRPELLLERANDVLSLEQRMHELDGFLIAVAAAPRGMRAMPTCRCGAPLLPGAHFCSNCGRPSAAAPPVPPGHDPPAAPINTKIKLVTFAGTVNVYFPGVRNAVVVVVARASTAPGQPKSNTATTMPPIHERARRPRPLASRPPATTSTISVTRRDGGIRPALQKPIGAFWGTDASATVLARGSVEADALIFRLHR